MLRHIWGYGERSHAWLVLHYLDLLEKLTQMHKACLNGLNPILVGSTHKLSLFGYTNTLTPTPTTHLVKITKDTNACVLVCACLFVFRVFAIDFGQIKCL